jgi:hypothetical protein
VLSLYRYLFELQVAQMPRTRLTKSAIDALPTPPSEQVYWDESLPGFGVKVTPAGRKVFIVLYRTSGAGSRLRKYTIGPYGRVTLHVARNEAQRVLVARTEPSAYTLSRSAVEAYGIMALTPERCGAPLPMARPSVL